MSINYKLTIEITGTTLDDLDQKLMEAATARLMARKQLKVDAGPSMPVDIPPGLKIKIDEAVAEVNQATPKTELTAIARHAETKKEDKQIGTPLLDEKQPFKGGRPRKTTEKLPETPAVESKPMETTKTAPTKEDATKALSGVNERKGIDAARGVLTKFEVQRLANLDPSKYPEFIQHCESL